MCAWLAIHLALGCTHDDRDASMVGREEHGDDAGSVARSSDAPITSIPLAGDGSPAGVDAGRDTASDSGAPPLKPIDGGASNVSSDAGSDGGRGHAADAGDAGTDEASDLVESVSVPYDVAGPVEWYGCQRTITNQDLHISRIESRVGEGTTHLLLAVDPSGTVSDGCTGPQGDWQLLFVGGGADTDVEMPEDVALHVPAGSMLVLSVHVNNPTNDALTNSTAVDVYGGRAAEAEAAEALIAGKAFLLVPEGVSTQQGVCTQTAATNVFAVFPLMRELAATSQELRRGSDLIYQVSDYSIWTQQTIQLSPLALAAGDELNVFCSYDNTTGGPLMASWQQRGQLCYAIVYRYPSLGDAGPLCVN